MATFGAWARDSFAAMKGTQKVLFEKLDVATAKQHVFELHVAQTYVGQSMLEKALEPLHTDLRELRQEIRELREEKRR